MQLVTSESVCSFDYTRYNLQSNFLGSTVGLGKLIPKNVKTPSATLYLLHGGNGDDQQPMQVGLPSLIDKKLLARLSAGGVQLVFPFVGASFLHDHPIKKNRAYASYFLKEVLEKAERGTTTEASRRFIAGFSIGGAAAMNIFFRHPELFSGMGAHFATLIGFDYLDNEQTTAYATRTGIGADPLKILVDGYTSEFTDIQDFRRHDPIALAKAADPTRLASKTIYFDCGAEDDFGLFEGAELLHSILEKKNIAHRFEKVGKGRHDAPYLQARIPMMLDHLVGSLERA